LRNKERAKGQLISKWFLKSSISSKKWTNKFDFTTIITQVDLFSFIFWRKLTTPKNYFEMNWPLARRTEAHSLCKQCLHDLHFLKKGILLTKPFQASQIWHQLSIYENKILVQNCLLNEWILEFGIYFDHSGFEFLLFTRRGWEICFFRVGSVFLVGPKKTIAVKNFRFTQITVLSHCDRFYSYSFHIFIKIWCSNLQIW
jgi:hypothetical protein